MDHWFRLQPHVRELLGEHEYATWIEPLQAVSSSEHELVLTSENPMILRWADENLLPDLRAAARSLFGESFVVRFAQAETPSAPVIHLETKPDFTFDRFVVGPSNQFASAAAEAVADRPGTAYNPLFLYGDTGLGKTHLLHAIANRVVAGSKQLSLLYITAEQFLNDFINAIRTKRMDEFRRRFRAVDVLLLDDIQFLAGKEQTQEEFFHTFNTLQSSGRQLVFTSDAKPADIQGLEERLRSRFLQGLIADIQPPDLETRCAILREKGRAAGWDLPEDVVLFISRRIQKNVRELEGCLNRTLAYAHLANRPLTVDLVRSALAEILPEERQPTAADIVRFVAHHYGVRVSDLKGRSNRRSIALPRQVSMYLIRHVLELSFPETGKIFGKHHSTVIYAVEAVQKTRQSNPDFDSTITSFLENFS